LRDDTVTVLDAFRVVALASPAMDEVRRRVQQATVGRRRHKKDPALPNPATADHGAGGNPTNRGQGRLEAALPAGGPGLEVTVVWHANQQLRSMFHTSTPSAGRATAERVLGSFRRCPIPEIARLDERCGRGGRRCSLTPTPAASATGERSHQPHHR